MVLMAVVKLNLCGALKNHSNFYSKAAGLKLGIWNLELVFYTSRIFMPGTACARTTEH
jgi:hypothetical protein